MSNRKSTHKTALSKIHPLMDSDSRRSLWRKAQSLWQQPVADVLAEIKRSRAEWDKPPSKRAKRVRS